MSTLTSRFAMADQPKLRGTKRSYDELVSVMDLWYKQESDAQALKILHVQAENKRLRRKNHLFNMTNATLLTRLRDVEQTAVFRQLMIEEIFQLFPQVHEHYTAAVETEEELEVTEDEFEEDTLTQE